MPTIKEVIKSLKGWKNQDAHIATSIWHVDDVITRAEEREQEIMHKEAEEIIQKMDHYHDATIGINWDVIDHYLFELAYQKENKK